MDSLAGLAFASEEPSEEALSRPPFSTEEPAVSKTMMKHIIGQSALQLGVLFFLLASGDQLFGVEDGNLIAATGGGASKHYTIVFNTFVLMQLFNQFNARKISDDPYVLSGLFQNPTFLIITSAEFACQVAIVQFGGDIFQTQPLSGPEWAACFGFGALALLFRPALLPFRVEEPER